MLRKQVDDLGARIYCRSIKPLRRHAVYDGAIIGFDTEYTSKEHHLLSMQLWSDGKELFVETDKLSPDIIMKGIIKVVGGIPKRACLVAYFTLAEFQHLDLTKAVRLDEYARGSTDAVFQSSGCEIMIVDLARWFDGRSLASAAEACGYKKMKWDTEHVTRATVKDPAFRKYAMNDARITCEMFNQLRKEFQAMGVDIVTSRTPASTSASVFRLHHGPKEEEGWYCDENGARQMAVLGMWGGRAEVFGRGYIADEFNWSRNKRVPFTEMDLKSAYPSAACAIGEMPIQGSWKETTSLERIKKVRGGFARVNFEFPSMTKYPCLPVATNDGCLLWPLSGQTVCTTYEVLLAIEMGAKVQIMDAWVYTKGTTALADYMRRCLSEREKSSGAKRVMWKLLGNSMIGKLGQHIEKVKIGQLMKIAQKSGMLIEDLCGMSTDEICSLAEMSGMKDFSYISLGPIWMPEWNGLVTGYVRAQLGRALWKAGGVYCHTDSVWTGNPEVLGPEWEAKGTGPVTIARTRLAALWSKPKPHVASHSIWDRDVAEKMLKDFDGDKDIAVRYGKSRPLHLKEAFKRNDRPGRWIQEGDIGYWHTGSTAWDYKRALFRARDTRPWLYLAEYYDTTEEVRRLSE